LRHIITIFRTLKQENLFKLSYFVICFLISLPIIYGVWNIIYSQERPAGGDPAFHTLYILKILKTGIPLIGYSQYSDALSPNELASLGYYPPLFHIIVALLTIVANAGISSFISVLNTMKAFVFVQYLIGVGAYALLIKTLIDIALPKNNNQDHSFHNTIFYYGLLVLAFGLFIYSTSPIVKTFRDGGYGEIFSMWCIFPFYIYFLIQKRWIISAILLAQIASTHNLSFGMTLIVTFSFFTFLLINRDFRSLKELKNFLLMFLILFLPVLIFFYAPTVNLAIYGGTGQATNLNIDIVIDILKPNLYYSGLIGSIMILFFNYKRLGFLVGWSAIYFLIIIHSNLFVERIARELSLPFGLITGIAISISIYKLFVMIFNHYNNRTEVINRNFYLMIFGFVVKRSALMIISIAIIILSFSYLYFVDRFESHSDPIILLYYNKAIADANAYLINLDSGDIEQYENKPTVVVFGVNPWLTPTTYNKMRVLNVLPEQYEKSLSLIDRRINRELSLIVKDPNSEETKNIIRKYNIRYIATCGILPGRWYPDSYLLLNSQLYILNEVSYIQLMNTFSSDGMEVRIYRVNSI
jgi:hypothetical protein